MEKSRIDVYTLCDYSYPIPMIIGRFLTKEEAEKHKTKSSHSVEKANVDKHHIENGRLLMGLYGV